MNVNTEVLAHLRAERNASNNRKAIFAASVVTLVIVLVASLIFAVGTIYKAPYGSPNDSETMLDLQSIARTQIGKALKYRHDATFGTSHVKLIENGTYAVSGTVKAPNTFGANLTHEYLVVLALENPQAKSWKTAFITLGDEEIYRNDNLLHRAKSSTAPKR